MACFGIKFWFRKQNNFNILFLNIFCRFHFFSNFNQIWKKVVQNLNFSRCVWLIETSTVVINCNSWLILEKKSAVTAFGAFQRNWIEKFHLACLQNNFQSCIIVSTNLVKRLCSNKKSETNGLIIKNKLLLKKLKSLKQLSGFYSWEIRPGKTEIFTSNRRKQSTFQQQKMLFNGKKLSSKSNQHLGKFLSFLSFRQVFVCSQTTSEKNCGEVVMVFSPQSNAWDPPWSVLVAWGWGNIPQPRKLDNKNASES